MSIEVFDNKRERLFISALGPFYDKVAQPMAWAIFRIAVGGILVLEGWPKITAPLGQVGFVENLGFYPGWLWSPMLAVMQFFGGMLLVVGLFTRPAALANAVMLGVTLYFHISHPFGHAFLTPEGIEALKAGSTFFTDPAKVRLADGGVKFLELVQGKAEYASLYWMGGAFLYAAFGGGYLSLDRLLLKKQF
ncbi:DoxX family protein [Rhizobium daejeonense]